MHEVALIFSNCAKFNKPSTEVGEAGKKMEEMFDGLVQKLLPDYWLHSFVRDAESPGGSSGADGKGSSAGEKAPAKKRKKRRFVQPPGGPGGP